MKKYKINYGREEKQFGDLRVPNKDGTHPVLIVIHGGCWTSKIAGLNFMNPFAEYFTNKGIATWNIEYRCIDNKGGSYPGTFLDIGNAIDYLRIIAPQYMLDLSSVVVAGHSSGGHLALWSAARNNIKPNSLLYSENPLKVKGVVNIAGHADLKAFMKLEQSVCGSKVINKLLDCENDQLDERLKYTSPIEMLPFGIKQVHIVGEADFFAPSFDMVKAYSDAAAASGDEAAFVLIKNSDHFEVITPASSVFEEVYKEIYRLFT